MWRRRRLADIGLSRRRYWCLTVVGEMRIHARQRGGESMANMVKGADPCLEPVGYNTLGPVNLDGVPKEYHDFANVFSKSKAGVLADHCPYCLKITLDEGVSCYLRRNYSPSVSSLTRIQLQDSSVPRALHMEHQYSSYARRMDPCDFVAIFGG